MKLKLVTMLLMLSFLYSNAQNNYQKSISQSLNGMVNSIKTKNIDGALGYIYPKLFTVIPKQQMKQMMTMTYDNPFIETDIRNFKINAIQKPQLIDKEYFSKADYAFSMKLKIDWKSIPNGEKMKTVITDGLYKKFGKASVKYDGRENSYLINAVMHACAISPNGNNWKLIIIEKEYKSQLSKVLPAKILNEF